MQAKRATNRGPWILLPTISWEIRGTAGEDPSGFWCRNISHQNKQWNVKRSEAPSVSREVLRCRHGSTSSDSRWSVKQNQKLCCSYSVRRDCLFSPWAVAPENLHWSPQLLLIHDCKYVSIKARPVAARRDGCSVFTRIHFSASVERNVSTCNRWIIRFKEVVYVGGLEFLHPGQTRGCQTTSNCLC